MSAYPVEAKLEAAIAKFQERNLQYGDAFVDAGKIAAILGDVKLVTPQDHTRYQVLSWIIGKLCRYCSQFNSGGHQDSIHDLIVYAAMLEAIDEGPKS